MRGLVAPCAIAGAVLAASCQSLLGLDPISSAPTDGARTIDGSGVDAAAGPPRCVPMFQDGFTDNTPCAPGGYAWGANGSTVTQAGGIVSISPPPVVMESAGCTADDTFAVGSGGIVVQLIQPLDGTNTYTGLQLVGPGVALGVEGGMLLYSNLGLGQKYGAVPYTSTMQWLRIRAAAGELVGEYWNGAGWTQLGTTLSANATGEVTLDASLYDHTDFHGPAQFANLSVCE